MSIKIYKDGKWQILPGQGSPGKSAYEYASENGFVGSEEDFANALGSIDDIADKIENIDTTPTEGSNNLVTSGGIHKALKDLSITGDVDLSNQLNEVEEDIDTLYNRTNDNEKNINAIIDILKGEEEWPDDWVPGDSACCETLREEVSELENRVSVIESTGGSGTVDVEKLKDTFDNRYLVKVEDSEQNVNNDTVFRKNVDIKGDLTVDNVKSSNFHSNGFAGSGFGITSDGTNHTLEIDNLIVRKEAHFHELVINQIRFTRGATVFSHAGATITSVEIHDDFYRCYYDNSELKSGFVVGDLGRCQRFDNVVEGFNDNVKNHYYWREIVGVGDDYFDLSKTNADGTGEPAEGDDVCQFGNINDESRQSAIVIDPQNGGSIEVYNKIDSFNLTDKNYVGMGTKDNESYIYGYGKMFFGSREDGGHYIKYENGHLVIKGDITIGDTDISNAVIGDETLSDLLDSLGDRINQIDNKIDYFSGSESVINGTLSFSNEWIANGEADAHVGDRYTCTTDNSIWQFTKNADGSYIWIELDSLSQEEVESLITKSLDGQKTIFTDTPTPPYDAGDLWVTPTFLKLCTQDREESDQFNDGDWVLVSDEVTNTTIKKLEDQIKDIMDNANDDDVSFYFDEDSEKNLVSAEVGDIFYAIDTTKAYKWNGASWEEIEENHSIINVLKELSKTASALDGKISCYRSDTKPESARDGDLWFDTTNNTLYVYNNGNWEETRDNSLDYLKELFPNYLQSGAVLTDILAIKNGNSVVAGMYGGSRTTDLPQLHDANKGSLMIFSGVGDFDDNTTYSTKIWSDGTIESEKFALNNEMVIINDDTIIIGNDDSGKITLGFEGDSNEIPILKYVGKDASTSWDMRNALFSSQDGDRYSVDLGVGKITYNSANTTWEFDGNLLVTGGVSFYTPLNTDVQYTYWDQLPTGDYFEKVDGVLQLDVDKLSTVIGGTSSGGEGIDSESVENIIKSYSYSKNETYTKSEVNTKINDLSKVYVTESDVNNSIDSKISGLDFVTRSDFEDYYEGYITVTGSSITTDNIAVFYDDTAIKDSGYSIQDIIDMIPDYSDSVSYAKESGSCLGNAATATKLKTSVELWGNSFDGYGNITGSISITTTNPCISFLESDKSNDKYNIQTNNGYLYIGHSASDYYSLSTKFDSSGNVEMPANLTVKGGITFYSQKSLKNIHETDFLSLDQLSNIHTIKYTWKDGRDDRMHVGGIADDIQKIIPEVIYENDGYLTMDYGNAGFVIGTSLIKPVVDHEKRIKELEEEVARLNNLLNA